MSKRQVKTYTEEFRQSSAKLAVESGQPVSTTAQELGIHEVTLHGWIKRYYSKSSTKESTNVDLLAELKRLQKENVRLKLEREILKKAAAYFAQDTL